MFQRARKCCNTVGGITGGITLTVHIFIALLFHLSFISIYPLRLWGRLPITSIAAGDYSAPMARYVLRTYKVFEPVRRADDPSSGGHPSLFTFPRLCWNSVFDR